MLLEINNREKEPVVAKEELFLTALEINVQWVYCLHHILRLWKLFLCDVPNCLF